MNALEALLVRLLRVPPEPHPPPGSIDSLQVFRAAPAFYNYSLLKWAAKQLGAIVGIVASLIGLGLTFGRIDDFLSKLWWLEALAITAFVLQAITSFLLLRLNYRMRWYMVSDSSVRIRQGIFNIREQTMTVANIQNMEVRQGPLQRLFGISDLEVRTAGGSGNKQEDSSKSSQQDPHVGALRGLDNANEVRDLIAEALRRYRDAGLGDPDEPASLGDDSSLRAARNMLDEVRGLRRALASR